MSTDALYQAAHAIENLVSNSAKDSLLQSAVFVIKRHIDANTKWDSVKHLTSHQIAGELAVIENTHHAAVWLDEGTPEHPIEAKNTKALRFEINGQVIFRRRVEHKGTKATRFWSDGVESGMHEVDRLLVAFGDEVFVEVH